MSKSCPRHIVGEKNIYVFRQLNEMDVSGMSVGHLNTTSIISVGHYIVIDDEN